MGEFDTADPWLHTLKSTQGEGDQVAQSKTAPRLVLVFESDRPLSSSSWYSLTDIHTIRVGRGPTRLAERVDGVLTVRVPDHWMSSRHAEFQLLVDQWRLMDPGSRNGCFINGERVTFHELRDHDVIELGHTIFMLQPDSPVVDGVPVDGDAGQPSGPNAIATLHSELQQVLAHLARLAETPVSFLIQGESGTGKEVLARTLHALSGRPGAFVGVNSAALPDTLIESELFGHTKGAFSGAVADRPGLIQSAHQGTLFLDEIGDLSLPAQAVLLRALQEREVRPVGGVRTTPVDIRMVSATHKDLLDSSPGADFRQDLYARIAGVRVLLPPLRERRMDLGMLIAALLPRVAPHCVLPGASPLRFAMKATRALFRHDWPMNIRELENCLLTAVALTDGGTIELEHMPRSVVTSERRADAPVPMASDAPTPKPPVRIKIDKERIVAALAEYDDNVSEAARALGLSRQALYRRMDRFGIARPNRHGAT